MRRLNPLLVPIVIAVVLLGGLGLLIMRQSASAPTPSPTPTAPTPTPTDTDEPVAREQVRIITDGWTVRTLKGVRIEATNNFGAYAAPVTFVPLTGEELASVRASAPEALVGPLARVLPQDDRLTCDTEKCSWAGQDVPDDWYSNPANVPGLGESYAGWGVESLLYTATVSVDSSLGPFRVGAEGWESQQYIIADGQSDEVDAAGPIAINGYQKRIFPMAAGLGVFFLPDPAWLGEGASTGFDLPENPVVPETTPQPPFGAFMSGLNTIEPMAAPMSSRALTTITSPSRGCAVGVLCTPEPIELAFNPMPQVSTAILCYDGEPVSRAVFTTGFWTATFPHPTHQLGIWGVAGDIETYGDGGYLVRGVPGLVPANTPVTGQLIGVAQFTQDEDGGWVLHSLDGASRQQGVTANYGQNPQEWLDSILAGPFTRCGA